MTDPVTEYGELIRSFVDGHVSARAFANEFMAALKRDERTEPEGVYGVLVELFGAADGLVDENDDDPTSVSPEELLAAARLAYARLVDPSSGQEHRDFGRLAVDPALSPEDRALAREAYMVMLPTVRVSTCPFTGVAVQIPLDTADLDGPFWDARDPARPPGRLPETVFSVTGAMLLGRPLAVAPFLAIPGPGQVFIIERLLAEESVVAVVANVDVGPHRGLPITYFSTSPLDDSLRLNEWGARSYRYVYEDGREVAGESTFLEAYNSYDVREWVDRGKLRWILPGDATWTVQTGVDGCPFLDLDGPADMQRIVDGELA